MVISFELAGFGGGGGGNFLIKFKRKGKYPSMYL